MTSEEEAVEALDEFIAALAAARTEMRRTEQFLQDVRQRVTDGEAVESLIASKPPAKLRQAFADTFDELNRSRHQARQKVFALAVDRGVSIADQGRAWGFSRQLAARYVNEVAGTTRMVDAGSRLDEVPTGQ